MSTLAKLLSLGLIIGLLSCCSTELMGRDEEPDLAKMRTEMETVAAAIKHSDPLRSYTCSGHPVFSRGWNGSSTDSVIDLRPSDDVQETLLSQK